MAWSPEQLRNAKVIMTVGRQLGASDRDILIALMAGWQESNLRNLSWGDRDSIGMFQQRNAWGSRADRLDPWKSSRMFFLGGGQGQRGLLDFKNRDQYDLGQAAQKVQVSAFPKAYDKWEDESRAMLKELGGSLATVPAGQPGGTSQPEPPELPLDAALTPAAPTAPLGVGAATSTGLEAAGTASATAPGLEAADKMPQLNQEPLLDLTGMVDQAANDQGSFSPGDSGGFGGTPGKMGNYDLPGVKPYVLGAANELGGMFGIKTIGGVGNRPNASDHPGGKALDFMTRDGGGLAAFAEKNWKRLHIKYIIWNQHIWNPSRADEGWRLMGDRGGDTANHKDHVHISFT